MHHTVTDGWSTSVICKELSAAYNAFVKGQTPELPPMPIQYADFAGWHRKWLAAGNMKTQVWAFCFLVAHHCPLRLRFVPGLKCPAGFCVQMFVAHIGMSMLELCA